MPDALTGHSGVLQSLLSDPGTTIVARLSKQPIAINGPPLTLADIVECDFPGYAPITVVGWGVEQNPNPIYAEAVSPNLVFVAGALVTPQDCCSLYLTISLGGGATQIWRTYPLVPRFTFDVPDRTMQKVVRVKSFDDTITPPDSIAFPLDELQDVVLA